MKTCTIPAWAFVTIEDGEPRIGVIDEKSTYETREEARWWKRSCCSPKQKKDMHRRGYKLRHIKITFEV